MPPAISEVIFGGERNKKEVNRFMIFFQKPRVGFLLIEVTLVFGKHAGG